MSTNDTPADPSRYGDFPQLFWDADPAALLDVRNPITLARLLMRADAQTVGRLVSPETIRKQLDSLQIPEYTRAFWRCVLEHVAGAEIGRARRRA
jgi:hypothetical protein